MNLQLLDQADSARGGSLHRGPGVRGDRAFRLVVTAAGIVVLMILAAITIFLIVEAVPALRADRANFLTERHWSPDENPPR
ncbi:MAG: phosphate ABC transporter permease subunit PstC, partial [Actinomycetes bacterium]